MKTKYYFIGILLTLALFLIGTLGVIQKLDNIFWDQLQQVYTSEVRKDITIVAIDDESLSEIGAWPWDRDVFAELVDVLDENAAKVTAFDITFLDERENDNAFQSSINSSSTPVVLASKVLNDEHITPVVESPFIGFTNVLQDRDGIVRFALLNYSFEKNIPSFAQQSYLAYLEKHPRKESLLRWNNALSDPARFIYGAGEFTTVSVSELLNGNFDPTDIKDHIVLIGSTAKDLRTGLVDNVSKVGGIRIPGVNLHAYIVSALLNKDVLFNVSPAVNFSIIVLLVMVLLFLFRKIKRPLYEILISTVLGFTILILSIVFFDSGYLIPAISYILSIISVIIVRLFIRYLEEKNSRRFISRAFSQYMNPELLNVLIKKPELLQLGGKRKEMTILFSDIRSFTNLSESLSPEDLVNLLNAYLDKMSHVIFEHSGIIDKFIGDAVMAFWNAPISDQKHANHAVQTALAMSKALKEFNLEKHGPALAVGIGVHTGEVIVGNMGSTKRFDFTVIGDNVNLSARLEGLTKKYGVEILISEDTVAKLDDIEGIVLRKLDEVVVKGKTKAISIYEPLADSDSFVGLAKNYETAFYLYQLGKMEKALKILEKITDDIPSQLLIKRIKTLNPLPDDWDGIWRWTDK